MSDLSRRSFLQSVCLGGIALSLPRPMDIVAATVKDLKDPPIMAAYGKVVCPGSFRVYGISAMSQVRSPMTLGIFALTPKACTEKLYHGPLAIIRGAAFSHVMMQSLVVQEGSFLEFWAVPFDRVTPLGRVYVAVEGYSAGKVFFMHVTLDHARLERTRAIKLGLIDPSEPEVESEVTGELIIGN